MRLVEKCNSEFDFSSSPVLFEFPPGEVAVPYLLFSISLLEIYFIFTTSSVNRSHVQYYPSPDISVTRTDSADMYM